MSWPGAIACAASLCCWWLRLLLRLRCCWRAAKKIGERIAQMQAADGIDEKEALKRLARELGQSKSDVYRELQRERARRR